MTPEEIATILELHADWRADKRQGKRADLFGADLSHANLSHADLSHANLSGANLSGAIGLCDPETFMSQFEADKRGILAYKTFGEQFQPPPHWRIEPGAELTEVVNANRTDDCGCGINVAALDWVQKNTHDGPIWRVLIPWYALASAVIPYNTDGKFRVGRCILLNIVEE